MKTLIIDDDKKIHDMFNTFMPYDYDIEPDSVFSAEEGIDKISKHDYDFVVCDYHMPPKTGIDVLNYINTLKKKPIVIMLTASDEKEVLLKSVDSGVFKYVEKSNFNLELITSVVDEVLEKFKNNCQKEHFSDLGESLAVIIHEINNPLAIIQGRACLLKNRKFQFKDESEKAVLLRNLDSIDNSCKKITEIINTQRNKVINQDRKVIGLNSLYLELDDYLDGKEKDENIRIDIEELNQETELNTNKNKIFQVLTNLINNSLDAVSDLEEKWIKLKVDFQDKKCIISCIDSGDGIKEEDLERIFEKFYTKKKNTVGTGVGLDVCKKIARDLGGDLVIDCDSDNTCFQFSFQFK